MSVQPSGAGGSFKTPLPNKFDGKKGDPAFTFLAACNNYRIMKPTALQTTLCSFDGHYNKWRIRQDHGRLDK